MGYTLSLPNKQDRLDAEPAMGPPFPDDSLMMGETPDPGVSRHTITVPFRPTTFRNTGQAIGTGIVGGLAATARTVDDGVLALGKAGVQSDLDQSMFWANDPTGDLAKSAAEQSQAVQDAKSPFAEPIQAVQDWSKKGEWNQGSGARALGSVARGLTILGTGSLFGGPVGGIGTLATVDGYNTYRDVQAPDPVNPIDPHQVQNPAVDRDTALKMAGVTAAADVVGGFLPFGIGIGKSAASGLMGLGMKAEVAGNSALATSLYGAARAAATVAANPVAKLGTAALVNTGFGAANRYATSSILADAGYKTMAAQYAPMDGQSLAADFIMGLAFGAHAEIAGHGAQAPHVDPEMAAAYDQAAAKPPSSMIDAALASRREEMIARGGGGVPIDPMHANLDANLQDGALASLLRGRDVSVSPDDAKSIVEGTVRDPGVRALNDEFLGAMQDHYGTLADFGDVERAPEGPAQSTADVLTRAPDASAPGELPAPVGALPHLSDFTNESLRQIATRSPDMPVDIGNGATVRAADLHQTMVADLAAANDTAKLHDAALACFART